MDHIPREFISLLLDKVDLVDLISARLPIKKKSANNFFACCPFHNEKTPSFSVNQAKQFYYCFGCGEHGNAIDFLMKYDHLGFVETIETLARQVGLEVPRTQHQEDKQDTTAPLYAITAEAAAFYQAQLKKSPRAIDYLKQRGLSGTIAKQFGLGYAPAQWEQLLQQFGDTAQNKQKLLQAGLTIKKEDGGYYDRFRDRIMFPIHDRRGRIIGFGGRIIDQGEPKYLNSPETPIFQKGQELYGLYQSLQANRKLNRLLVVEGYMDVIALFQHGINYAVATLGTATTPHHLHQLLRYTNEIIFCFDGDEAGRRAAWRAFEVVLPMMHDELQIKFMFLPEGDDPDTLVAREGKERFEEQLSKALTFTNFFFHHQLQQADLSSMDGRARFTAQALVYIKQLAPGVLQEMLLDELAKKARITAEQLKQQTGHTQSVSAKRIANGRQIKSQTTTPLRLALILLVQHPELAHHISEPLPELSLPAYPFFIKLIEICRQHPHLTTGGLLEFWREQKEEKLLAKLASWELVIPETGVKEEFLGAIRGLTRSAHDQVIQRMLAKAAQQGLSDEEKSQLTQLIADK